MTVREMIAEYEGKDELLYSCPENPYESIYIRARITDGTLTVTDSECEHGPDGGWSHRILQFDRENTEKVFALLMEREPDPFRALGKLLSYEDRTRLFTVMCDDGRIEYRNSLSF